MISFGVNALVVVICGWGASQSYGLPAAALWRDQLFVASAPHYGTPGLYRGTFTPTTRRVGPPLQHHFPPEGSRWSQAKIDIRDDRVLLSSVSDHHYIFPMEDVPPLENSAFGNKLREARDPLFRDFPSVRDPKVNPNEEFATYTRFIHPFSAHRWSLLQPEHRTPDVPLSKFTTDDGDRPSIATYGRTVRHDVLIAGPKSVRLFHAYKDKFFVSVEPDYLANWYLDKDFNVAKNLPKPPERELRTGKLPADFTERFAAYTSAKRDYLVANNGKVYMSVPKGKTEVEVSAVWNDPKQKIVGVVQDLANDAVYGWGFVTDSSVTERFYVKLEPKPVAVAYKRTVPLWGDRSGAYLESYECARAFRNAAEKK